MLLSKVIHVNAEADYKLAVQFANGESEILDMRPYLDFGVFVRLQDPATFAQVTLFLIRWSDPAVWILTRCLSMKELIDRK